MSHRTYNHGFGGYHAPTADLTSAHISSPFEYEGFSKGFPYLEAFWVRLFWRVIFWGWFKGKPTEIAEANPYEEKEETPAIILLVSHDPL